MKITSTGPALGATVTDVDLRDPLAGPEIDALLNAWYEHHLLLFPDQQLSDDEHVRFGELFGPVQLYPDGNRFNYVTNHGNSWRVSEEAFEWHMDYGFTPHPITAISLHAHVLPPEGTSTFFANSVRAFETLPEKLKDRILSLEIQNLHDLDSKNFLTEVLYRKPRPKGVNPHVVAPLARLHPIIGKRHLFCCHMMTDQIIGLDPAESDALLEEIFEHLYSPANIYEHRWEKSQLIIWDNTALHHARPDVSFSKGARLLRRVCVAEKELMDFLAPYKESPEGKVQLRDV